MPATPLSAELNALPLEQLIGSLAGALVKAQGLAADETARFIDAVAFEPANGDEPPALRMFDFTFTRAEIDEGTDEVVQRQVTVALPLLSILNIPSISIGEATMDLHVRIVAHGEEEEAEPAGPGSIGSVSKAGRPGLVRKVYSLPARAPKKIQTTQGEETVDSQAALRVKVTFRQDGQPLGIDKLMNLADTAFNEAVQ